MRDVDVRRALLADLDVRYDPSDTRVVNEFGICNGASRVDVAVINGQLTGFEIKSAVDRLDRLPGQCEIYGKVLDRVTLVAAEEHLDAAASVVPAWWGLVCAANGHGDVSLASVREAGWNPSREALPLARLLWKEEALELAEKHGLDDGVRSKPRRYVWRRLVEGLDLETLAAGVRAAIKTREGWRESQ